MNHPHLNTSITSRRSILRAVASVAAVSALPAWSQDKPITLVVAYPPGGGADLMARMVAPVASKILGQNIVIDNRGGATGQIAAAHVAKAAADGNTLLLDASPFVINPSIAPKLSYNVRTSFEPIAVLAQFPNILVCHPSFGAQNVADLLRLAKAKPKTISYATSGIASGQHLAGVLFEDMTKTQLLHVPYRGGGPAFNDVIGGQVPLFFANLAAATPHLQAGRLRALAVTSPLRARTFPSVPTMDEAGLKGYEVMEWNPVMAPAGLDPKVTKKLVAAFSQAMTDPEVLARVRALSGEPFDNSGNNTRNFLNAQQDKWARVIQRYGITVS
jgi:tripartite-type tricarboxylate transporter receptor subunit TctC